jgi:hypothetical protein
MGMSTDGKPITPWAGSWAHQEQQRRQGTPWMPTERERREASAKIQPSQHTKGQR